VKGNDFAAASKHIWQQKFLAGLIGRGIMTAEEEL
jgi:hypothetical protein